MDKILLTYLYLSNHIPQFQILIFFFNIALSSQGLWPKLYAIIEYNRQFITKESLIFKDKQYLLLNGCYPIKKIQKYFHDKENLQQPQHVLISKTRKEVINILIMEKSFTRFETYSEEASQALQNQQINTNKLVPHFWPNQVNPHSIEPQIYVILKAELQRQSKKLVDIISENVLNSSKPIILNLVTIKSLRLLHAIQQKNKQCLLQQLRYEFIAHHSSSTDTSNFIQQFFKIDYLTLKGEYHLKNILVSWQKASLCASQWQTDFRSQCNALKRIDDLFFPEN